MNLLIDDLCLEENKSDLFLSASVSVNDQLGKWRTVAYISGRELVTKLASRKGRKKGILTRGQEAS